MSRLQLAHRRGPSVILILAFLALPLSAATGNVFSVDGAAVFFNGTPFKVIGLRCSNALVTDAATQSLIDHLPVHRSHGVNTVSVFLMGARFGDVKGYLPDASLATTYRDRMARIIEAADAQDMIVLIGCLYWGTSRAKEDLGAWTQSEANAAVANTVRWLSERGYRNVFVDPDNEGMANAARGWSIAQMIDAAHAVDPSIMVGYNDGATPPSNADLYLHFSPKVSGAPWIESEGSSSGYWGSYSKQTHQDTGYYNYSRIGRYSDARKTEQLGNTYRDIDDHDGYLMASTWLQCGPAEGVGGPFHGPGGQSDIADVDADIDTLHPDAGVRWWLEAVRDRYGAWNPGGGDNQPPTGVALVADPDPVTGTTTTLTASASDPDGDPLGYAFAVEQAPPGAAPAFSGSGVSRQVTFDAAGAYRFAVTVSDGRGGSASIGVDVAVTATASRILVSP